MYWLLFNACLGASSLFAAFGFALNGWDTQIKWLMSVLKFTPLQFIWSCSLFLQTTVIPYTLCARQSRHGCATRTSLAAGEELHNFQSGNLMLQGLSTRRARLLEVLATFPTSRHSCFVHLIKIFSHYQHRVANFRALLRPSGMTFHGQSVTSVPSACSSRTSRHICSDKTGWPEYYPRFWLFGCSRTGITARKKIND